MRCSALVDRLRVSAPQLSVGVLTADWLSLGSQLKLLDGAGVELLHFDVMDGSFCPMLTFGAPVVAGLKTSLLKDVHLMMEEPLTKVEGIVAACADIITVHAESTRHVHRMLQALGKMTNANDRNRGIVRGLALNPGTPLESVDPLLDELELVLLLAVNPGWGGQKFIPSTRENVAEVARMGVDIIVTGSAVFDGRSPLENARYMLGALQ